MGLKDLAQEVRGTAFDIQEFMWEGRPGKSNPREHTVEEYREFLENIRKSHWSEWNSAASEYGWK